MVKYQEIKFMEALSEHTKSGPDQRLEVIINDNGLFLTLDGVTINYGILVFRYEPQEYLHEQLDRHPRYLRRLHDLLHESALDASSYRRSLLSSLFFSRISDEEDLDKRMKNAEKDVIRARLLTQAALEGKHFFEKILVPGDEGLLQEYYGETLRRYPSLEKIEEYNSRLIDLAGRIEQTCTSLLISEIQKVSRLKEQHRLRFPEPE